MSCINKDWGIVPENDDKTVYRFRGEYAFLSNFHNAEITTYMYNSYYSLDCAEKYEIVAKSSEHLFQASKCMSYGNAKSILHYNTAIQAKRNVQVYKMRPNWLKHIRYPNMLNIIRLKFLQNLDLADKLVKTKNLWLIEGNYWHDNYWGICYCSQCRKHKVPVYPHNKLGLILMQVRQELIDNDTKAFDEAESYYFFHHIRDVRKEFASPPDYSKRVSRDIVDQWFRDRDMDLL